MGRRPAPSTVARRDAILAALRDRSAVTVLEVCDAIGSGPAAYGQVYADLRALARADLALWLPAEGSGGYGRALWIATALDPNTASDVEEIWRLTP